MTVDVDRRTIKPEALETLRRTILEIFSSGMYQDVGIRQICQEARVSPQTVYKYFGNKEEMLYACIKGDLENLYAEAMQAARAADNTVDKCLVFLDIWCEFYFANPSIARIVFLNIPQAYWLGQTQFTHVALHDETTRTIAHGQSEGLVWDEASAELLGQVIMGMAHRLLTRWLMTENADSAETKHALAKSIRKLLQP
ncbi:HTH-type transcriptional regulator BetI [Pseudovibrio sp. Ad46]|uniref:TetR/AcrR family transcriptional regulator n=1 Tax=Pseudovibrio sp. Ad46 TaxID=989432 RepID=UPI0007AEB8B0|nr:TetR/AcrR family transcriptional regulator [Pseudovibrio sp. Ad46]KZK88594.1 HTH-type transcriptional regulator BetI [Pseudovibrio sp. Ad46]